MVNGGHDAAQHEEGCPGAALIHIRHSLAIDFRKMSFLFQFAFAAH